MLFEKVARRLRGIEVWRSNGEFDGNVKFEIG